MSRPEPSGGRSCRRVIFYGRVQGVGFRYTTTSIAKHCHVEGYVRNLPDGSVEVLAEGTGESLDRLFAQISAKFPGNIQRQTVEEMPSTEPFAGFEIRR